MNVQIRSADTGDEEVLGSLWHQLATDMVPYSELNELTDRAEAKAHEAFEDVLDRDSADVFLLSVDDREIGYMYVRIGENPNRMFNGAWSIMKRNLVWKKKR